ncbi:MAG: DUF924 family protein [Gemmatimonas sp.]
MIEPPPTPTDVLAFWFGDVAGDDFRSRKPLWFEPDAAFDAEVRNRFEDVHFAAARGELSSWRADPRGALALVIVLDQFPRNMYRGTARAFATDPQALAVAREAIDRGFDRQLAPVLRLFLYLPFEHSESLADQDRSVALFAELGDAETLDYARRHREIIARFGRFPHRNAVLGRASTAEEVAFLKEPGSSF